MFESEELGGRVGVEAHLHVTRGVSLRATDDHDGPAAEASEAAAHAPVAGHAAVALELDEVLHGIKVMVKEGPQSEEERGSGADYANIR